MTQPLRLHLDEIVTQTEELLDSVDPATLEWEDPVELRRIGAANENLRRVSTELRDAVSAARAHGRSWAEIGVVLGISKQAAQQRFGR
jgi:DNA-directed RNA polymerase specialized sigma24 family protein